MKNSRGLVGPGPNYFSNNKKNVWVDTNGYLHLTIIKSNNTWQCAEVICKKPIGYGTYTFTIAAPKKKLDPNVVFGLFTWDTATYKKEANSEIDIEFSQWTDPNAPNLHYSVQPTCGTDEKSGIYRERTKAISTKYKRSSSIHEFTWTPNKVSFSSIWQNKEHDHSNYIAKWHFNKNNPLRRSSCGTELSDPIGIPAPGTNTEVRINLWLVDGNHDKKPDPPCSEQEIIIKNFIYQPLK